MASIANDPGGRRRILFLNKAGDRKTIWLGKMSKHLAEEIKTRVERISNADISGCAMDRDTAAWVGSIGKPLHAKLVTVGLVSPREPQPAPEPEPAPPQVNLGDFVERYIDGRTDTKERTRLNLRMFGDRLIKFLGAGMDMGAVKRSDADAWIISLKSQYADATVGRTIKGARQLFEAACRADLITRNPFNGIKAGSHTDKERQYFVTREVTQRVMDACPDAEWRLIVALSRYGGLRCPSEHLALTWADVNWSRNRFRVDSPKTGERWVPIFDDLAPYLNEAYDAAEDGVEHVITSYRDVDQNLRRRLAAIIRKAGLTPWPKPFHNMRASRETELARKHPLHVVCAWIGNSQPIAAKHYLQVTDDDFERAAKGDSAPDIASTPETSHPASQHPARTEHAPSEEIADKLEDSSNSSGFSDGFNYARRDSNPQPMVPKTIALSS
jgi:integrase